MHAGQPSFDLVETMRFDPEEGLLELERHLARLKASAEALDFAFDRHDARNELHAATFRLIDARRVHLRLSRTGAVAIEATAMPALPVAPVAVRIVPLPVELSDIQQAHCTSDRDALDAARAAAGTFEVALVDREGFLTQGSFTTLFLRRADGLLVTPPLSRGIRPGVLRDALIAEGDAVEGDLRPGDLAAGFLIGNAIHGLIEARPA